MDSDRLFLNFDDKRCIPTDVLDTPNLVFLSPHIFPEWATLFNSSPFKPLPDKVVDDQATSITDQSNMYNTCQYSTNQPGIPGPPCDQKPVINHVTTKPQKIRRASKEEKREANRLAAARCRQRKEDTIKELKLQNSKLIAQNSELVAQNSELMAQNSKLIQELSTIKSHLSQGYSNTNNNNNNSYTNYI